MKRDIICAKCRPRLRGLWKSDSPHPGEHVKFVDGTARGDFKCDSCGCNIKYDEPCTALSIWADYGGVPYTAWEPEFIKKGE